MKQLVIFDMFVCDYPRDLQHPSRNVHGRANDSSVTGVPKYVAERMVSDCEAS